MLYRTRKRHVVWMEPVPIQMAFSGPVLMQMDRAQQVASMHEYRRAA